MFKKSVLLSGFNSSWTKSVPAFPSLWKVLAEMQERDRGAGVTFMEDCSKVCISVNCVFPMPIHGPD